MSLRVSGGFSLGSAGVGAAVVIVALGFGACAGERGQRAAGPVSSPAQRDDVGADELHAASIDWSDYGLILFRVCAADGGVNRKGLRKSGALIEEMIGRLAEAGPDSTPSVFGDRDARTGYYINAANLLMLAELTGPVHALVRAEAEAAEKMNATTEARVKKARIWHHSEGSARLFRVDSHDETAFTLQAKARAAAEGDWRVRLALFSGRMDGPPLWHRVVLSDMLDVQLDQITRAAMKSPRVVRPDFGVDKRLLVCEGLFEVKDRLIADYERRLGTDGATLINVLMEWLDGFDRQTMNAAVGYPVERMEADWRLPVSE